MRSRWYWMPALGSLALLASPAMADDLSMNDFGPWTQPASLANFDPERFANHVTPIARMPTTGTADYKGAVAGGAVTEDIRGAGGAVTNTSLGPLSGDAAFRFNFGTGAASSVFSNLSAKGTPVPITLASNATGGGYKITGNTFMTLAVLGGSGRDQATASGSFYGPNAQFVAGTLDARLLGLGPNMSQDFFINDAKFGAKRR